MRRWPMLVPENPTWSLVPNWSFILIAFDRQVMIAYSQKCRSLIANSIKFTCWSSERFKLIAKESIIDRFQRKALEACVQDEDAWGGISKMGETESWQLASFWPLHVNKLVPPLVIQQDADDQVVPIWRSLETIRTINENDQLSKVLCCSDQLSKVLCCSDQWHHIFAWRSWSMIK